MIWLKALFFHLRCREGIELRPAYRLQYNKNKLYHSCYSFLPFKFPFTLILYLEEQMLFIVISLRAYIYSNKPFTMQ